MKPKAILLLSASAIVFIAYTLRDNISSRGSGNDLAWQSFNVGLEQAAEQNKKILVDVYTDWCGWCKKMDKEVYTDSKVVAILNEKFVLVKLDAESSDKLRHKDTDFTEREFASAIGATGYPSTIFFEPDAEPITLVPGYMEPTTFANVLRYIGEDHYKNVSYEDFLMKSGQKQ